MACWFVGGIFFFRWFYRRMRWKIHTADRYALQDHNMSHEDDNDDCDTKRKKKPQNNFGETVNGFGEI